MTVSTFSWINGPANLLQVLSFEILFCSMQENPEILTVHPEFAAYFVPVPFVEKDRLQKSSIPIGHVEQNLTDLDADLTSDGDAMGIGTGGRDFDRALLIERLTPGARAVMFEEDVVADGIDEGAEALGLAQSAGFP